MVLEVAHSSFVPRIDVHISWIVLIFFLSLLIFFCIFIWQVKHFGVPSYSYTSFLPLPVPISFPSPGQIMLLLYSILVLCHNELPVQSMLSLNFFILEIISSYSSSSFHFFSFSEIGRYQHFYFFPSIFLMLFLVSFICLVCISLGEFLSWLFQLVDILLLYRLLYC